jgi:ribose transport system ATP-binding protein
MTTAPKPSEPREPTAARSVLADRRDEFLLAALILLAVAGFTAARPDFFTLGNLLNIGQQSAIVAIVAFGMTSVIIARGIDISVGGTLAASGIVAGLALGSTGSSILAMLAAVATGVLFGALNAAMIAGLGISAFIATLGTMALAKGAALSLSRAASIAISDPWMLWPGQASIFGVPCGLVIALALCVAWSILLRRTVTGRSIFAVGGNAVAARASLIPVRAIQSFTYIACGASAGVAAIIGIGRLGSAQPLAGAGLEFAAITAAVVGGASLAGGRGSVVGTMLGAIAIGTINAGLAFLGVSQQVIYMVSGGLILIVVFLRGDMPWAVLLRARPTVAPARISGRDSANRRLAIKGLTKQFAGIKVLDDVSLDLNGGEVVALMGENGAGKSTLVKCLAGVYQPDGGSVAFDVSAGAAWGAPGDIAVIHQHFSLVPDLTIAESLSLGREPAIFGIVRRRIMRRLAASALHDVGLHAHVDTPVRHLTVGERQMLEVAKALLASAWLVVMDEPTSALSNRERDQLYAIVQKLTRRGCCVLYISHKMEEVRELASRAVVLRDGRLVADRPMSGFSERELVQQMVGRDLGNVFPWIPAPVGATIIEIDHLQTEGLLRDVSLSVRQGEVLGLAGLMGSGRTDILRCVAGLDRFSGGSIRLRGKEVQSGQQLRAARAGVAFIPEDRRAEGIVGCLSAGDNLGLIWMRGQNRFGMVSTSSLGRMAAAMIRRLDVRPANGSRLAGTLSGGNQQKVVIGKWLAVDPRIILLDEPTSGVDVGAKSEIHRIIGELKAEGAAIVLVSSELPELLGVSDRIVVIREGRSVGEFPRGASEQEIMELAFATSAPSERQERPEAAS